MFGRIFGCLAAMIRRSTAERRHAREDQSSPDLRQFGRGRRQRSDRDSRVARRARVRLPRGGRRARRIHSVGARPQGQGSRRRTRRAALWPVSEHHPARKAGRVSRRHRNGDAHHRDHSLERAGDGHARQRGLWRTRRTCRELRLRRRDFRGRLQSFLPRRGRANGAAMSSSSSLTRPPASTLAPSSKAGSPRSSWSAIGRKSAAPASRPIPIPG